MKLLAKTFFAVFCLCAACVVAADNPRALNFRLFDAAGEGDLERVRQLLDEGALVSARNRFGNTALIYAARATAGVGPPVQAVGDL